MRTLDCQEECSARRPKGLGRACLRRQAEARPCSGDVSRPCFSTRVHTFAQSSQPISIDAQNRIRYLPHQIEPGSLKLYGSV